jgi:Astacin (Peptidase family M12A)
MRYAQVLGIAAILTALVPAASRAQPALPTGTSIEDLLGTIIRDSKWPSLPIKVCWENPGLYDGKYRAIVRSAAEETWQRYSAVRFVGWDKCTAATDGIHIKIADEGPHTKSVGKYLDKQPDGMVLNFTFGNWSTVCQQQVDFCVYAIAVHEFGHAIGFTHEQNRPDAPQQCQADSQGPDGDYLVTKYDPNSIMNYCNPQWNGDGKLSELDIKTVQTIYGER